METPVRTPSAYAAKYEGPSGQLSPTPVIPSSVSTKTTVLSNDENDWVDQLYDPSFIGKSTWKTRILEIFIRVIARAA